MLLRAVGAPLSYFTVESIPFAGRQLDGGGEMGLMAWRLGGPVHFPDRLPSEPGELPDGFGLLGHHALERHRLYLASAAGQSTIVGPRAREIPYVLRSDAGP